MQDHTVDLSGLLDRADKPDTIHATGFSLVRREVRGVPRHYKVAIGVERVSAEDYAAVEARCDSMQTAHEVAQTALIKRDWSADIISGSLPLRTRSAHAEGAAVAATDGLYRSLVADAEGPESCTWRVAVREPGAGSARTFDVTRFVGIADGVRVFTMNVQCKEVIQS